MSSNWHLRSRQDACVAAQCLLRMEAYLPGEPVARVMLPGSKPETRLLVALHQCIEHRKQLQPCRLACAFLASVQCR